MWQAELKAKFGSKADAGPLYTLVYDTKFARQHGQRSWQRQSRPQSPPPYGSSRPQSPG